MIRRTVVINLLSLLDGGQNQPLWKLLKSDLKTIGILFLLAIGLGTAISVFSPEPQIDSEFSQSLDTSAQ
jgi:hypothetical protein